MAQDPTPTTASPASSSAALPGGSFFGHPRGLATLFFTEFWERFSYYGMRALLTLFMTASVAKGGLGFPTERAGAIYGLYTAFVYLLALPGGWLADRLLGQRRAVFLGGCIIAAGHFSMAIDNVSTFFLGLVLIVIGTGLLKPNISAMVGELYPEGGARRDAGFSIFYMGINLGAFVAPLVCGPLGENVNWHLGFAAAGIGMVLGLIQYAFGGKYLGQAGLRPNAGDDPIERSKALRVLIGSVATAVVLIALFWTGVIDVPVERLAGGTGIIIVGLALLYFVFQFTGGGLDGLEKKKMLAIFVLFLFSALFWSGFEQAGSSLTLFARDLTDRVMLGREMPVSVLQSVNPLFIIAFAPVFAWLWLRLSARRREPSAPAKFSLGLVFLGLGFGVMVWASMLAVGPDGQAIKVSPMWLILTYLFHTFGELCLSPVGLSTVTKLAPHRKVSQLMGIWFMSISLGNLMAGLVAGQFEKFPLPQLFGAVFATTAGAGLILALLIKPIRKLMGNVH
ncbi:MAG TPA: peptide MFS transporter [Thermoanaerobaculia bacterium]|nr:peptide MFS transporter [Thermoanaerobaculia bacterium]